MEFFNDRCGEFVGYYTLTDFELGSNLNYERMGDFLYSLHRDIIFSKGNVGGLLTWARN